MISRVLSSAVLEVDAYVVDVEADIALGLPSFNLTNRGSFKLTCSCWLSIFAVCGE